VPLARRRHRSGGRNSHRFCCHPRRRGMWRGRRRRLAGRCFPGVGRNHAQLLSLWIWSKVVRRIALGPGVERLSTYHPAGVPDGTGEDGLLSARPHAGPLRRRSSPNPAWTTNTFSVNSHLASRCRAYSAARPQLLNLGKGLAGESGGRGYRSTPSCRGMWLKYSAKPAASDLFITWRRGWRPAPCPGLLPEVLCSGGPAS
jgi:hypothetical protein